MKTAGTTRTVLTTLATLLLTLTTSIAQETRPVDVVVMLDTSGSMENLLDATRARVWDVVNELGRMKPTPELRVGLVSFGTDKATEDQGFIIQHLDLTGELDEVYAELMGLTIGGGDEFVGRALNEALDGMSWSPEYNALRVVFVAGNESADQGVEDDDFRIAAQQEDLFALHGSSPEPRARLGRSRRGQADECRDCILPRKPLKLDHSMGDEPIRFVSFLSRLCTIGIWVNEMGQPLASFPVVSTRDTDEAEYVLSRELAELRFKKVQDRTSFCLEMNAVHLGRTSIGYNRFGAETLIDPGQIDEAVVFATAVGRPSVFEIDGQAVHCTGAAAVVSPPRRVLIHRPAGSQLVLLRAGYDAVEERFREVFGRGPRTPLVFDSSVDLAGGVGAQAHQHLRRLIEDIERDGAVLDSPVLRAGFEDLLLSALLALPNNCSNELIHGRQSAVAPLLVRRAEEYLEAHATGPITISDVVTQCGCSRKALFNAFRRYRGYTPMQFLADTRLRGAREALQSRLRLTTSRRLPTRTAFLTSGDSLKPIAHDLVNYPRRPYARACWDRERRDAVPFPSTSAGRAADSGVRLGVQNGRRSWYSSDYSEKEKGGKPTNR